FFPRGDGGRQCAAGEQPSAPNSISPANSAATHHHDSSQGNRMRLPPSIIRIMLREYRAASTPAMAEDLAREAIATRQTDGGRAPNKLLLARIGLELTHERDEGYYLESLHYHLGLLFGHMRQPERMAEHIRLSGAMPSPDDDQLFSDRATN